MNAGVPVCVHFWTFWLFFFLFVLTIGFITSEIKAHYLEVVFLQNLFLSAYMHNYHVYEFLKKSLWK